MIKLKNLFALGILATTVVVVPGFTAQASLGGDMTSVRDDQARLQGTLRTTSKETYDVHEIQATSGIVVREYVSHSGAVFGVAWHGRTHPDLHQLLGAAYDQYLKAVDAQRAQHHGHGPLLVQEPGLVLQMGGHMGALSGMAYLPRSMPAGVRAEDIQ